MTWPKTMHKMVLQQEATNNFCPTALAASEVQPDAGQTHLAQGGSEAGPAL